MDSNNKEGFLSQKLASILANKLDVATKFKLLDMIDERPVRVIDTFDPQFHTLTDEKLVALINGDLDFIVTDSLLSQETALLLRCREEGLKIASQMKEAGYGRGNEYTLDKKVRGDKFIWLTHKIDDTPSDTKDIESTHKLVELLTPIRDSINQKLSELGMNELMLDDREIQLAEYEGNGEYYLRHKDAFRLDPNNIADGQKMRKLTVIAYLNPDIATLKS